MSFPENNSFSTPERRYVIHNNTQSVTRSVYVESESYNCYSSSPGAQENSEPYGRENVISPESRGPCSEGKRGRPRADVINSLIIEGSQSPSSIKCKICNRVFPREKSLQAHLRTHTG